MSLKEYTDMIKNHALYPIADINKIIQELVLIQTEFLHNYGVNDIFSNSKFYEIVIANQLNHKPIPGHSGSRDAEDESGNQYEYKVYKTRTWNFQDISEAVLNKYYLDKKIILAVVDKTNLVVKEIYSVDPNDAVPKLKEKLQNKIDNLNKKGGILRRRQISLSFADIKAMPSFEIIYLEIE